MKWRCQRGTPPDVVVRSNFSGNCYLPATWSNHQDRFCTFSTQIVNKTHCPSVPFFRARPHTLPVPERRGPKASRSDGGILIMPVSVNRAVFPDPHRYLSFFNLLGSRNQEFDAWAAGTHACIVLGTS